MAGGGVLAATGAFGSGRGGAAALGEISIITLGAGLISIRGIIFFSAAGGAGFFAALGATGAGPGLFSISRPTSWDFKAMRLCTICSLTWGALGFSWAARWKLTKAAG